MTDRKAFYLRLRGLTYGEIAEALGYPDATAARVACQRAAQTERSD